MNNETPLIKGTRLYMLGIGGMGMLPLALYANQMGFSVCGYDDSLKPKIHALLVRNDIQILTRPDEMSFEEGGLVVYSSAITPKHPFFARAVALGLSPMRRGHFLAQCAKNKKLLAVVGSHGKTTTTAWLVHLWQSLGIDCSYAIGGLLKNGLLPGHFSETSEWLIAEVDESDGTIDAFSPELTLVVNYDWDHADRYTQESQLQETFLNLFDRTRSVVILPCGDKLQNAPTKTQKQCFGLGTGDYSATLHEKKGSSCELQGDWGTFPVSLRGRFNALNALAALAATHAVWKRYPHTLGSFSGVCRRQDLLFQSPRWNVLSDYAHHPREIRSFLQMAQQRFSGPLTVIFQPHRYTRTRQFAREFAEAFQGIESLYLLPVYAASEAPLADGTTEAIQRYLPQAQCLQNIAAVSQTLPFSDTHTWLFVGAGDIEEAAHNFTQHLKQTIAQKLSPKVRTDEPLAPKTTLGVGGCAAFYAEPSALDELTALVSRAKDLQIPVFFLGRGSNTLVDDNGFDGLVVHLPASAWGDSKLLEDDTLWVGAGMRLKQLAQDTCERGWSGFEFLEGIPGTVGGAIFMNAGAMGGSILDRVTHVHAMDAEGTLHIFERTSLTAEYRSCPELKGYGIIGAIVQKAGTAPSETIRATMATFASKRKASQPRDPSAGCAFRNPPGDSAGRIIDQLGLKGTRIGSAVISPIHGNFIVNESRQANTNEILSLIRKIHEYVLEKKQIALTTEVVYLGKCGREPILF